MSLPPFLKPTQISTDAADFSKYGQDWTRQFPANPKAILFPESTEEVQKIVKWARETKTSLVPSGGRTGLSAGAVASNNEVVLSLERMNKILSLNKTERLIRVQAGAVTETVQNYVEENGFFFPIDLASRGSSMIGGNISTNAGGTKVIRFGHTRDWVLSLQVVTGRGDRLELNKDLIKNNTGYDLKQLFIGAEGTLGVITEASLRLTRPFHDLQCVLISTSSLESALKILEVFQLNIELTAFEFFTRSALEKVLSKNDLQEPFSDKSDFYVLIEYDRRGADVENQMMAAYEKVESLKLLKEAVLSQSPEQFRQFWKYRELISESLSSYKPYKNDISVKISNIPSFVKQTDTLMEKEFPQLSAIWFGHIGDGNLHLNIIPKSQMPYENFVHACEKLSDKVFVLLQSFGGSISAEHGIGLIKKPFLHYTRSSEEIEIMRGIKKVFDPDSIINPGKIFDI